MGALSLKPRYLLDSAILIDILRGVPQAVAWSKRLRTGEAIISVITRAEVLSGGPESETEAAVNLCDLFDCVALTPETADRAARLRRLHRWKLPDAFQAALAQQHACRLVTRNTKDFDPDVHDYILLPYTITPASG